MKILNSNRFYLAGTNKRFLHMATVADGIHEYMAFVDKVTTEFYIEEITGSQLTFIEDDNIVKEIAELLYREHITNIKYGAAEADNE